MKQTILLLTVFIFAFSSCSKDDDSDEDSDLTSDPLIGTWKYHKFILNGEEVPLEPCENEETLVYDANGTYSETLYDGFSGNCESLGTDSGTWTNNGDGSYSLKLDDESEFDIEIITFQDNTFYLEFKYDSGTPDDTSDDILERDFYIKQ